MPRGGWLREVRRWACCGLRRTGGPSPGFWGVFIIAVHRAFVLGLGARHRGMYCGARVSDSVDCGVTDTSEDRCVSCDTDSVRLLYFTYTYSAPRIR